MVKMIVDLDDKENKIIEKLVKKYSEKEGRSRLLSKTDVVKKIIRGIK